MWKGKSVKLHPFVKTNIVMYVFVLTIVAHLLAISRSISRLHASWATPSRSCMSA